eukprot:COSAG01_NODE_120_length_25409_cov_20.648572_20_plen_138_part_00
MAGTWWAHRPYKQLRVDTPRQGKWLGRALNRAAEDMQACIDAGEKCGGAPFERLPPFCYKHRGSMAYVGSGTAVAELPSLTQGGNDPQGSHLFSGELTYWVWRSVYMSKLLPFTKRVAVGTDWARTGAFGRDTSRHE